MFKRTEWCFGDFYFGGCFERQIICLQVLRLTILILVIDTEQRRREIKILVNRMRFDDRVTKEQIKKNDNLTQVTKIRNILPKNCRASTSPVHTFLSMSTFIIYKRMYYFK